MPFRPPPSRPGPSLGPLLVLLTAAALAAGGCGSEEPTERREAGEPGAAGGPEAAGEPGEPHEAGGPLRVAVTVDDVPRTSRAWPGIDWRDETHRLLAHLTERDVPFTAFVTCAARPAGGPFLPLWREAGAEPGNHAYHHRDLNDAPLDDWLDDVRTCHDEIARDWGRPPTTFRYPYLHRGPTEERKAAAAALLDSLGTPDAPVTIDNSEWVIAGAYGDAPPDSLRDARFRELYVDHMLRMLEHYRERAREKLGRDPAHVLLVHANALNARHLGAVLDAFREQGVRFVPLGEALQDPLYDLEDRYTGPRGISWIYRIEPATPELDERFDQPEEARLRSELAEIR